MDVGEYCLTRYRSSFSLEPYSAYCVAWLAPEKMVSLNSCYLLNVLIGPGTVWSDLSWGKFDGVEKCQFSR